MRIIHTPWVTKGSVCFYLESPKAVFLVDIGQYVTGYMLVHNTNIRQHEESMHRMAMLDFDIACLAHGQVLQGNTDQFMPKMLECHFSTPMWLRILHAVQSIFILGRQTGFREH